jgi:hypothetical protein
VYKIVSTQAALAGYKAYQYAKIGILTEAYSFLEQLWRTQGISSRREDRQETRTAAGTGHGVNALLGTRARRNFARQLRVRCVVSSNLRSILASGEKRRGGAGATYFFQVIYLI